MKKTLIITSIFIFFTKFVKCSFCVSGGWIPFDDEKCIKLVDIGVNREEAEQICNSQTKSSQTLNLLPTLVSIKSPEEQQFLKKYLFETIGTADNVWISAKRKLENTFEWSDGSEIEYENWAEGYPTNDTDRKCVQLQSGYRFKNSTNLIKSNDIGKWMDVPCRKINLVLCEMLQIWSFPQLQKAFLDTKKKLNDSLQDVSKQLSDTRKELESTKNDLITTKIELSETKNELANTKTDLTNTKNELANTKTDLTNTNTDLTNTKNELVNTKTDLTNTKTDLANTKNELANTKTDLTNTKTDLANTKNELANTKTDLTNTKTDLTNTKNELANTKTDLTNTKTDLTNTKNELANTKTDLTNTKTDLTNTKNELTNIKSGLSLCITGIRFTVKEDRWVFREQGHADSNNGYVITGVHNFNSDQYIDNLHIRQLQMCKNGIWTPATTL